MMIDRCKIYCNLELSFAKKLCLIRLYYSLVAKSQNPRWTFPKHFTKNHPKIGLKSDDILTVVKIFGMAKTCFVHTYIVRK